MPHARFRVALLLAILAGLGAPACDRQARASTELPANVLVFVVDTLRADALSCYGNPRNTSPNLDAFAREGLLFEAAYASAPYTATSHASLFSSTYPAVHGVWNELKLEGEERLLPVLAPGAVTLAEALQDAGYQTAAIADGGWVIPSRGLDQGFAEFHSKNLGVEDRVRAALDWMEARDQERPFFLFLHTYQVHTPYMPPAGYEDRFAGDYRGPLRQVLEEARAYAAGVDIQNPLVEIQDRFFKKKPDELSSADLAFLRALYEAELSLVDEQFALLMAYLRIEGLLEDTIVVVTSDHGEEFGEHGELMHKQVYEELLHVPLLIRLPGGRRGARWQQPVQLVDLMPTLLAELELPVPATATGRVLDLRRPETPLEPLAVVGETNLPRPQRSIRIGDLKAVFHADEEHAPELFDLASDPREQLDLAATAEGAAFLDDALAALRAWLDRATKHREAHDLNPIIRGMEGYSADKIAELQALGYIGG